jgi:acyl-CoA thioester hydrolase
VARHVVEVRARWGDADPAGIVFYPQIFRWFDAAAEELFRALGLPWTRLFPETGLIGLPILEAHCRFVSPIHHDDRVRVETEVEEVRDKVFRLAHRVVGDGADGAPPRLCAEGYEVRGWVERRDGRLHARPIPEGVRALLSG